MGDGRESSPHGKNMRFYFIICPDLRIQKCVSQHSLVDGWISGLIFISCMLKIVGSAFLFATNGTVFLRSTFESCILSWQMKADADGI